MFGFYFQRFRYSQQGEEIFPEAFIPFERLSNDLKRKYPNVLKLQQTLHEELVDLKQQDDSIKQK